MTTSARYRSKLVENSLFSDSINCISFSPLGGLFASADSRGCLVLFDVHWGCPVHLASFGAHIQVFSIAWLSETELIFGCSNGIVASLVYRRNKEEYTAAIGQAIPEGVPGAVTCLAYKSGYAPLLAIAYGNHAEVWRRSRGKWSRKSTYSGDTVADQVASLAFLENGDLLVAYYGSGISIWSVDTSKRIQVPGLRSQAINSFSYSLDGLLLIAFDSSDANTPHTNLYRFAAQPPYGLTEVQNWPGLQWDMSSVPIPISISGHSGTHIVACSRTQERVVVIEVFGLAEQFTPSIPSQCHGEVLDHSPGHILAVSTHFSGEHTYIATAAFDEGHSIRVELWTSDFSEVETKIRPVRMDNVPIMLWRHSYGYNWANWLKWMMLFTALSIFIGSLARILQSSSFVSEAVSSNLGHDITWIKWHQGILDHLRHDLGNGACSRIYGWPLVQAFCPEIQVEADGLGDVYVVEPVVPTLSVILL